MRKVREGQSQGPRERAGHEAEAGDEAGHEDGQGAAPGHEVLHHGEAIGVAEHPAGVALHRVRP